MQNCKIIPLAGEGAFSPVGKHLVVCEEKKISVYDAISGTLSGHLPDLPLAYDWHSLLSHYRFSPKGTYFYATYAGKIWNLTELKEYLPGILAARKLELWNAQETVFLSSLQDAKPAANIWHVHNTVDGTVIHSIDHRQYGVVIQSTHRISPNGKLLASIYSTQNGFGQISTKAVIINLNYHVTFGFDEQEIPDAHQIEFCPDNEHVLVAAEQDKIWVHNCKNRKSLRIFECATRTEGYLPLEGRIKNSCSIKPQGLMSTITNRLDPKEKYLITQVKDKFACTKLTKPHTPEKVTRSLSGNLTLIRKNKKRSEYGGSFYDIFLQKKDGDKTQQTCLLKEIYKTPKNITFAGCHDEHLILIDPLKDLLYLFDPYSGQELEKIDYRSFEISPTADSLIVKAKEREEQNEKWNLYILPNAAQILGKQRNSYFSLLPEDLRLQLRNYTT